MTGHSIKQPIRVWQSLGAALLLVFSVAAAPVPAQAAIQEIRVLATGVDHSSHKAAEMALDYAKKRAVYLVARKMQVDNASAKIEALRDDQLREIIRGATVLQTRREGEVTYADVSVSIVDEALRRALGIAEPVAAADSATDAATRGVLVLPVYVGHDRAYMWENENLLNEPLRSEVLRQARGAVLVPAGDFDDRRLVDYQNALEVTADELKPMFARYGVDEIVVAIVTPGAENTLTPSNILLRRLELPPTSSRVEQIPLTPLRTTETSADRAAAAAAAIASALTQIASATSQLEQDKMKAADHVAVKFHYASSHELGEMQQAVRGAPGVLQLSMPAISLSDMKGVLYLSGKKDDVRAAIAKQGYVIKDDADGWIVSLR